MKKITIYLLLLSFLSINIFATQIPTNIISTLQPEATDNTESDKEKWISFAYGLNLSTDFSFSFYDKTISSFDNSENVNIWLKLPLNKNHFFACEGFYNFSLTKGSEQQILLNNTLDLSLFKFAFKFFSDKAITQLTLGRFFYSDTTNLIYFQDIDGIFTKILFEKSELSFLTGYTGLTNLKSTDYFQCPYINEGNLYILSPKYLVASANAKFNIFNTQFFNTEFLASVDLDKLHYHKMFTSLSMNGAISKNLYYILQSSLGMNIKSDGSEKLKLSNLTKLEVTSYFNFLNSSLSLSGIYASAEKEQFSHFSPITLIESSYIGDSFSSILKSSILYTFKPMPTLLISLGSDCICSLEKDVPFVFEGIQWQFLAKWQLFSDLYFSTNVQQYLTLVDENPNYFTAGIRLGINL